MSGFDAGVAIMTALRKRRHADLDRLHDVDPGARGFAGPITLACGRADQIPAPHLHDLCRRGVVNAVFCEVPCLCDCHADKPPVVMEATNYVPPGWTVTLSRRGKANA